MLQFIYVIVSLNKNQRERIHLDLGIIPQVEHLQLALVSEGHSAWIQENFTAQSHYKPCKIKSSQIKRLVDAPAVALHHPLQIEPEPVRPDHDPARVQVEVPSGPRRYPLLEMPRH